MIESPAITTRFGVHSTAGSFSDVDSLQDYRTRVLGEA
jgi:hypothetical protein